MLTMEPGEDVAPYHDRQAVVLPRQTGARGSILARPGAELLRPLPRGSLKAQFGHEQSRCHPMLAPLTGLEAIPDGGRVAVRRAPPSTLTGPRAIRACGQPRPRWRQTPQPGCSGNFRKPDPPFQRGLNPNIHRSSRQQCFHPRRCKMRC
jgi:hypothetical protein